MGVWAAQQALSALDIPIRHAVAINGTPFPVDNGRGIPEQMAKATLDGLTPESLMRFYRRMFGSGTRLKQMEQAGRLPCIDFEERKSELFRIIGQRPYTDNGFGWHEAIVGTEDAIFPVENMRAYWHGHGKAKVREIEAPHYPFHLFTSWEEVVGEL